MTSRTSAKATTVASAGTYASSTGPSLPTIPRFGRPTYEATRPVPRPRTRMATPRNTNRWVRFVICGTPTPHYTGLRGPGSGLTHLCTKRPLPPEGGSYRRGFVASAFRRKLLLQDILPALDNPHGQDQ